MQALDEYIKELFNKGYNGRGFRMKLIDFMYPPDKYPRLVIFLEYDNGDNYPSLEGIMEKWGMPEDVAYHMTQEGCELVKN